MVQKVAVSPRIANGQTAHANEFPYQAGLLLSDGENWGFCGGYLISNEWVLTAAHCTLMCEKIGLVNPFNFSSISGIVYLGSITHLDPIVRLEMDKCDIKVHPDMETTINDVALIKIPAVTYSAAIKPVSLPKFCQFESDLEHCVKKYGSSRIDTGKICTSTFNRIGACDDDSGGPLVLASSKLQIGIMSFHSHRGCKSDSLAVHTRVTSYLDWIRENTGLRLLKNIDLKVFIFRVLCTQSILTLIGVGGIDVSIDDIENWNDDQITEDDEDCKVSDNDNEESAVEQDMQRQKMSFSEAV
ncbi:collagenase-like [Eurosta solidaginis]|uniref:collagenase-like n=1 Tax=Eurosta solidaginis TaxID=178769 RepID=UPI003530E0F5